MKSNFLLKWGFVPALTYVLTSLLLKKLYPQEPRITHIGVGKEPWFGKGERPKDTPIASNLRRIKIKVSQSILDDLNTRLRNTRYHDVLEGVTFEYGFNSEYMKKVVEYWKTKYDWMKQEALLNRYEHYKVMIDGLDVHFVHVKPANKVSKQNSTVLFIHGWPGSFYEFYKAIDALVEKNPTVEIICPSIPGYGFSDIPRKRGFDHMAAANVFLKMMSHLGHTQYYIQAGDWGAFIGSIMSLIDPSSIKGLHLNMVTSMSEGSFLKILVGSIFPALVVTKAEQDKVFPYIDKLFGVLRETGYLHLQATKPDTIGFALNDSPVGLAAYILEKFSVWTHMDNRFQKDGNLTQWYTLDELLTNVMIYWVTGTVTSSVRFYKEVFGGQTLDTLKHGWQQHEQNLAYGNTYFRRPIQVPTGVLMPDQDLGLYMPKSFLHRSFPKMVHYTAGQNVGHFSAFQRPQLVVNDLLSFMNKVENGVTEG